MCHSNSVCTFPSRPVLFAAAIWVQLRWMRTRLTNNDCCSVPSLCSFIYAIFLSHGFQFQSECSSLKLTIDKLRCVFFLPFCSLYHHGHGHGSRYDLEPSTFPEARNAYAVATLSIGQCHGGPTANIFQRSCVGYRDDSWVPPKAVTGTEKGTGPGWGG